MLTAAPVGATASSSAVAMKFLSAAAARSPRELGNISLMCQGKASLSPTNVIRSVTKMRRLRHRFCVPGMFPISAFCFAALAAALRRGSGPTVLGHHPRCALPILSFLLSRLSSQACLLFFSRTCVLRHRSFPPRPVPDAIRCVFVSGTFAHRTRVLVWPSIIFARHCTSFHSVTPSISALDYMV